MSLYLDANDDDIDEDTIPSDVSNPIDRIPEQTPIIRERVPLLELVNQEIPGSLDVSDNGVLYAKYLSYTNLTMDLTDIYDKYMISNLTAKIKATYIPIYEERVQGNFVRSMGVGIRHVEHISSLDKTPMKCRQLGQTYATQIFIIGVKIINEMKEGRVVSRYETNPNGEINEYRMQLGEIPTMYGSSLCITKIKQMGPRERFAIGECPDDPPGYFIIEGKEYFFPLQDKLKTNYPYTIYDKEKYSIKMTCDNMINATTSVNIFKDIDMIYKIGLFSLSPEKAYKVQNINIFQIYRIMGIPSETAIKMILAYTKKEWMKEVRYELLSTANHLKLIPDDTQNFYEISGKFKELINNKAEMMRQFRTIIEKELFTHYPENTANVQMLKLNTMSMMVAKLAETIIGLRPIDKRDSWTIKRIASVGMKMYQIFLSEWKAFIDAIYKYTRKYTNWKITDSVESVWKDAKSKINLKIKFESSFKGNWGTNKYNKKTKQTDILKRQSKLSAWADIKRITTPGSRENKNMQPREPQMSQYGYISVVDTPEGKDGCGLTKNVSVTAWISVGLDETILFQLIEDLFSKGKVFPLRGTKELFTILFINGKIMGSCLGVEVKNFLISMKRSLILPKDIGIILDDVDNVLYIYTDNGRLTRPLLIINPETSNLIIDEKKMWDKPIEELIGTGCLEYIDTFEQEYTLIAPNIETVRARPVLLQELRKAIRDLEDSKKIFEETGDIEYDILTREKENRNKRITTLSKNIENYETSINYHTKRLENLKESLNEETDPIRRKTKFIDINYSMSREIRSIKYIEVKLKREKSNLDKLIDQEELVITVDYFTSQLEIANDKYKRFANKKPYTHCEIHNSSIMSISESVIPLANRNPTARVGYQCGMGRQALGIFHSNQRYRFDTTAKSLVAPTAPIVSAQNNKIIGIDKYGHGRNVIVAVMPYYGFTQEDSIIISQGFVDRGGMRSKVERGLNQSIDKATSISASGESQSEELTRNVAVSADKDISIYRHLGSNGIARPESVVRTGDCLIGIIKKITNVKRGTAVTKDASVYVESEYDGYVVDRYNIVNTGGKTTIKITLRDYRFPAIGDKFTSRIAQKSTISIVMSDADMPFTENGIKPDIIISPMAFTSRMTGSFLIEMLMSKAALLVGRRLLGGAFDKNISFEEFSQILRDNGYNYDGFEIMYSGVTGKAFKAQIYMGPVYYHALKHQVKDKIQARQRGTRDQLTNQPIKGKKRGGGIKFGEMERDTIVSHGASRVMQDVGCISADQYTCIVCQRCKNFYSIHFSVANKDYKCQLCESSDDVVRTKIPFAAISLSGIVSPANIRIQPLTKRI